ncbi:MAG: hypothetical protein LBQ90_11175 [Synergistaceae bacterium]|nr:hypothetical protein [Synergistaceae bacterium]
MNKISKNADRDWSKGRWTATGGNHDRSLRSLTSQSSLLELLRALYEMVLDYCVLRLSGDSEKPLVFAKDQLISLIERNSPETAIADLPELAARGFFRPVTLPDPENLRVLVVGENGADVSPIREALAYGPSLPEWWEAPLPLAICSEKKLHFNPAAIQVFGPEVKRLAACNLPDRDEFLVELEGVSEPCLLAFRRLTQNVFTLEDSTGDAALAEDIAWWASIGKAWAATLDGEKRAYRRCAESEVENLRGENMVLPCEWEGRLLGYFCVEKPETKPPRAAKARRGRYLRKAKNASEKELKAGKEAGKESKASSEKKPPPRQENETEPTEAQKAAPGEESQPLRVLGPQAMGLLAPGSAFDSLEVQAGGAAEPKHTARGRKVTKNDA